jgi:hypothetical protein
MKGGEPISDSVCILLNSRVERKKKNIVWKDKPLGISLSGNSIFQPHEIKKFRVLTPGNELLSPEDISKYLDYIENTKDEIKKLIPLDDITEKLKKQSASVSTDDINVTSQNITWEHGYPTVKTTKHEIAPNRTVYCKLVNGNATIKINISSNVDKRFVHIPLAITYTIIVDLDGIIQCVVVDYTHDNESYIILRKHPEILPDILPDIPQGIRQNISTGVVSKIKEMLANNPNSYLTTIPLTLETPKKIESGQPERELKVRVFSKVTSGVNKLTYTPPKPIRTAAFERVQRYIESTVSWKYEDGLRIFRILDETTKKEAFINITGIEMEPSNGTSSPMRKIITSAECWEQSYFDINKNDKDNLEYLPKSQISSQ